MITYEKLTEQIEKEIPNELIKNIYSSYDLLGLAVKFINRLYFDTSYKLVKLADKISNIDDKFYYLYRHSVMMNIATFENKYEEEMIMKNQNEVGKTKVYINGKLVTTTSSNHFVTNVISPAEKCDSQGR